MYCKFWGKAKENEHHLLAYHGIDASSVAREWIDCHISFMQELSIAVKIPLDTLSSLFLFFIALHDVGKFSVTFQKLCPDLLQKLQDCTSKKQYIIRHDQLGWMLWDYRLSSHLLKHFPDENEVRVRDLLDVFAKMAFGHHGLPPDLSVRGWDALFLEPDQEAAKSYMDDLWSLFMTKESCEAITWWAQQSKGVRKPALENLKIRSWQLAGAIVLCDWIASGDTFPFQENEQPLTAYHDKSLSIAKNAFEKVGLYSSKACHEAGCEKLFPDYAEHPTPLQTFCDQVEISGGPQLWILEDVTGSGKTEAACTLVSRLIKEGHAEGAFVALPTMATSNAMYERMAQVYKLFFSNDSCPSLVLTHGARHLSETFRASYTDVTNQEDQSDVDVLLPSCSEWLADSTKKALLADVGIGTLDQVLLGALPVRFQSLRALGMSSKVLVVDEVHAYDPYMLRIFANVIAHHARIGSPVILLSATLPHTILKQLCLAFYRGLGQDDDVQDDDVSEILPEDSFPRVTRVDAQTKKIRHWSIEPRKESIRSVPVEFLERKEEVYRRIDDAHRAGQCVCWIRNTIKDVVEAYAELKKAVPAESLDVFHSRFTLADRLDTERRVLSNFGKESCSKNRSGRVLIASQVVEQSLDLDFDVLVSDLAPIDLMIQRAGRLHRHLRNEQGDRVEDSSNASRRPPVFYVHAPPEPNLPTATWFSDYFPAASYVYPNSAQLWQTKEILKKEKQIVLPDRARNLIEAVYGDDAPRAPGVFDDAENEANADGMVQRDFADFNKINFKKGYDRQSSNRWDVEERVPTRLGDKQRKLFLACLNEGELRPYYQEQFGWDLSMIKVRAETVPGEISYSTQIQEAIDELKKNRRFDKDDLILVVEDERFSWTSDSSEEKPYHIQYQPTLGLQITFSENNS